MITFSLHCHAIVVDDSLLEDITVLGGRKQMFDAPAREPGKIHTSREGFRPIYITNYSPAKFNIFH